MKGKSYRFYKHYIENHPLGGVLADLVDDMIERPDETHTRVFESHKEGVAVRRYLYYVLHGLGKKRQWTLSLSDKILTATPLKLPKAVIKGDGTVLRYKVEDGEWEEATPETVK